MEIQCEVQAVKKEIGEERGASDQVCATEGASDRVCAIEAVSERNYGMKRKDLGNQCGKRERKNSASFFSACSRRSLRAPISLKAFPRSQGMLILLKEAWTAT